MRASYTDQFDHALDDKGRLTIPSEWRGTDYEEQLFAFPSKDGCLKVYPASWLGALQEKIAHLPMVDPQRKQIEAVAGMAQKLVLDSQGRVRIKDSLLERAAIGKSVRLIGALDHFEVWEPQRRESVVPPGATLEEMNI